MIYISDGGLLTVNVGKELVVENQRHIFIEINSKLFQMRHESHIVSCYGSNTIIVSLLVKLNVMQYNEIINRNEV
jgi:hypothetical protein